MTYRSARVVIRCDVGPGVGVGHVMRCLALAEGLAERSHEVVFLADLDSVPWAREQVVSRGFGYVAPLAEVAEETSAVARLHPWLVVVDSYLLPAAVYDDLSAGDAVVLSFTDGDPQWRRGHLLLDQNIGAENDVWTMTSGARRLAGLEYALMRDSIRSLRPPRPREEAAAVPSVFAFFGGTDAVGAAPAVATALAATGLPFRATFVAARAELAEELARVRLAGGQELEVTGPVSDLASRATAADLVLSAAGTSSWELFCLGSAAAFVCVADNQVASYQRVLDENLAGGLGLLSKMRRAPAEATAVLEGLLASPERRATLRERAWQRVDGRGRDKVIAACEEVALARRVGDRRSPDS